MSGTSSLSADAKDALARTPVAAAHCRAALRDGLAIYGVDARAGAFRTQRPAVARLAWSLLDDRKERAIRKVSGTRLYRLPMYEIDAAPDVAQPDAVLADATLADATPPDIARPDAALRAKRKPSARCDRRMELRGAFLACGSLAAPARGYHLEFVPPSDAATDRLLALLRAEGLAPKVAPRKGKRIVYFKDVDAITELLAAIGASQAVFALEDVRALKETKNRIHRLVNTEAANVDRATSAAVAQRAAIEHVADAYGFANLTKPLREIAELRLAHPTETLAELGRRCDPPVRKSTANHRIATLVKLASTLG